jgi:hypothetical protein
MAGIGGGGISGARRKAPNTTQGDNMATDPFATSLDQINTLISELLAKYSSFKAPESSVGDDDSLIQDYLSQAYGGARNLVDSYTLSNSRKSARGSYNNAGGAAISQSQARHEALKALAAEYSGKYGDAVKNANSVRESRYTASKDALASLNDLIANRNKLIAAQKDWLARSDELQFNREQATFKNDLASQENQRDIARLNTETEQRNAQRDDRLTLENRWRSLTAKARLVSRIGRTAAGWTNSDDLLSDRLGVQLGYYDPWQRKLEVRVGSTGRK